MMREPALPNRPGTAGPPGTASKLNGFSGPSSSASVGATGARIATPAPAAPGAPTSPGPQNAGKTGSAPLAPSAPAKINAAALAEAFARIRENGARPRAARGLVEPVGDVEATPRPPPSRAGDIIAAFLDAQDDSARHGVPIPDNLVDAFANVYARHLRHINTITQDSRGRDYLATAIAFCREGWMSPAIAHGWTTQELFALHRLRPWDCRDAMGAAYLASGPVAVTADRIVLRCGGEVARRACCEGVVP